ncbi:c-type cytochrome [Panacibacter sp. DH6]|uniref:C-type cytochrome n=1 Tax=Panacibacter microcysteis TaxID=2793269 RepID=A0A931E0R3_9BACT|nr:c-type cytochrome [Panacibacter microcysteis]MBG9374958.1 c-type cytochrome [Panacibacter microcysteis]
MFKKIAKWTGIILLVLITGISVTAAFRQNVVYDAPYPQIKASTDSVVIARGRHLAYSSAHCVDCHSTANADSLIKLGLDVPLSGGFDFDIGIGHIYSKNITPDSATGIGRYTDAELARALRYGVHPNGTVVFDFMQFHNMSDDDLVAVLSFIRSQKPVYNKVPDNSLDVMGKLVKAFLVKPAGPTEQVPVSVVIDTSANYGRYLANSVAECNGCHTKRDMSGAFTGEPFGGGNEFAEHGNPLLITPNLTPDSSSRIFGWSQADFIKRFRMGKIIPYSPMPWQSFGRMTDDELKAIYKYLQTLQPAKTQPANSTAKK